MHSIDTYIHTQHIDNAHNKRDTTTLIHTYNYIHINTNTITNIHIITIWHIQDIHAR